VRGWVWVPVVSTASYLGQLALCLLDHTPGAPPALLDVLQRVRKDYFALYSQAYLLIDLLPLLCAAWARPRRSRHRGGESTSSSRASLTGDAHWVDYMASDLVLTQSVNRSDTTSTASPGESATSPAASPSGHVNSAGFNASKSDTAPLPLWHYCVARYGAAALMFVLGCLRGDFICVGFAVIGLAFAQLGDPALRRPRAWGWALAWGIVTLGLQVR